ncbi:MAG: menaquinone biosynthesis protein [Nitrospirae bacterium]|nr:menaquinone biosynthesis protein [Nitrospirota bacterium]
MSTKLRIGEIRYANCTPIYTTLKKHADCREYEFVTGEPAALNAMLAAGELDVSPSSSIEYVRHAGDYLIVPDVSISSTGDIMSILLFSRVPVESLGGKTIAVSSASATSTVLLSVLLKNKYGVNAELVPCRPELASMLEGRDAALLIGDEALKENLALPPESGIFVYDLGGIWREFTGLPFVFALWMVREDAARREPGLVDRFKADIVAARTAASGAYPEIAAGAAEAAWMGGSGLVDYWSTVSYELGPEHVRGLSRFYDLAAGVGACPAGVKLRFV